MSWDATAVVAGELKCSVADRIVKECSQQKVVSPVLGAATKLIANLVAKVLRKGDETLAEVGKVGWIDVEILRCGVSAVAGANFDVPCGVVVWKPGECNAFIHGMSVATPNDPKLRDCGARRGSCEGGAKKEATDV